jgi:hypothetical protein
VRYHRILLQFYYSLKDHPPTRPGSQAKTGSEKWCSDSWKNIPQHIRRRQPRHESKRQESRLLGLQGVKDARFPVDSVITVVPFCLQEFDSRWKPRRETSSTLTHVERRGNSLARSVVRYSKGIQLSRTIITYKVNENKQMHEHKFVQNSYGSNLVVKHLRSNRSTTSVH